MKSSHLVAETLLFIVLFGLFFYQEEPIADPPITWRQYKDFKYRGFRSEIAIEDCKNVVYSKLTNYFSNVTDYSRQIKANHFSCKPRVNPFWSSALVREQSVFWHLKDVFVSSNLPPVTQEGIIRFYYKYDCVWGGPKPMPVSRVQYENVICCFSQWPAVFGHFLTEILAPILLMPQEILNKSLIVGMFNDRLFGEYLSIFGISPEKVVWTKREWVFAKNVYTITNPEPILGSFSYGIPNIKRKLTAILKLDQIKPINYILVNRPTWASRCVHNMPLLCSELKAKYPQIDWKIMSFYGWSAINTIKYFAATKMFIAAGGSDCYNVLFMNNGSSHLALMGTAFEQGSAAIAALGGIWFASYSNPWLQFGGHGGETNITNCLKNVAILMYAMNHSRWPSDVTWKPIFNLAKIRKEIGDYPYSTIVQEMPFVYAR